MDTAEGRNDGGKEEGDVEDHQVQVAATRVRPGLPSRKSSFSQAFTNLTSNPFSRRRTPATPSEPAFSEARAHSSRIHTSSGLPGSASCFGNLNTFASKPASTNGGSEGSEHSAPTRRPRRISDRLIQTQFFSNQQQRVTATPMASRHRGESTVQIEQRALMAPLHPPMPRSSTMGTIGQAQQVQNSTKTPSFMRPTSSSTARRSSLNTPPQRNTPAPRMSAISGKESSSERHIRPYGLSTPVPSMPTVSGKKSSSGGRTPSKPSPKNPTTQRDRPSAVRAVTADASKFSVNSPTGQQVRPSAAATLTSTEEAHASSPEPEKGGIPPSNNSPATEHTSSPYPSRRYDSPFEHPVIPRSTLIPAPIFSRAAFRHDMTPTKALPYSHSMPVFGDHGSSSLQIQEYGSIEEETVAEMTRDFHDESPAETVVPAGGKRKGKVSTASVEHDNGEKGDEMNSGELTSTSRDNEDDANTIVHLPSAPLDLSNPRLIHAPLPPITWLGRYTSLSDRFQTGALPSPFSDPSLHEPMHDEAKRNKRIFIHLGSLCTTEEARRSLAEFKGIMEARARKTGGGVKGEKVREKGGFFGGLMGRRK